MIQITLFSTDGCHLCEQAIGMFYFAKQQKLFNQEVGLKMVDIVEQENLIKKYGERIPVLLSPVDNNELGWPFELEQLVQWVNESLGN